MKSNKRIYLSIVTMSCLFLFGFVITISVINVQSANAACPSDISGKWIGNDGGTYFIQQNGNTITWFGSDTFKQGEGFSNVFFGKMVSDTRISGPWADVPMSATQSNGEMSLNCDIINGVPTLTQASATGGFGGTVFTKDHKVWTFSRIQSGDCEMFPSSLIIFSDGKAKFLGHAWTTGGTDIFGNRPSDAWIVSGLNLRDSANNVLFTFPKFSSKTLPMDVDFLKGHENDPNPRMTFVADLLYPANLFNSVDTPFFQRHSC